MEKRESIWLDCLLCEGYCGDGLTTGFDVAHGWFAEEAAVFAVELAGAFVADFKGSAGGVEAIVEHSLSGNVEAEMLLVLQRAHGG